MKLFQFSKKKVDAQPKEEKTTITEGEELKTAVVKENNTIVLLLVLIAFFTVIIAATLTAQLSNQNTNTVTDLTNTSVDNLYWDIDKIQPSESKGLFNITVGSNAGNIREYKDLYSFGLSQDKLFLAVNSQRGLEVINLKEDTRSAAKVPTDQYSGDMENAISWSTDSKLFALSIINKQDVNDTRIWIFAKDGSFVKEITSSLPTYSGVKITVEPVFFSKQGTMVLTRTYKVKDREDTKEDGSAYAVEELPIYLSVYDTAGTLVKDLMVRDYATNGSSVYYKWDLKKERFVDYIIYSKGETVDPTQDFLFTKISI